ncbi:hypothetical protein CRM22_011027, partial [Opisthorchis felineus]
AVFTDKLMILAILKYQVPEPASAVLVQSALVCLLYSRLRKDLLWPSLHDVDFYTELTQCLHNIIMDPSEPASRFLAIRVYDALLEKVAAADNIIGGLRKIPFWRSHLPIFFQMISFSLIHGMELFLSNFKL